MLLNNIFFRIVIPSVLFATMEYFPKRIIKGESIEVSSLFMETLGGLTYWFTSALAVAELLFLLLLLSRNRNIWFYVSFAVFFSIVGTWTANEGFSLVEGYGSFPWQWKHGLICMVYMAAGGLYWKYELYIRRIMKNWLILLLLAAYCFGSIYWSDYLYKGYMVSMLMVHPVGVIWGVIASILLIEVCRRLPEMKLLTFIGQNSIGFYFMSGALPIVFSIIAHRLLSGTYVWVVFLVFLGCMVVSYFVMRILIRWLPWLFDLRLLQFKDK